MEYHTRTRNIIHTYVQTFILLYFFKDCVFNMPGGKYRVQGRKETRDENEMLARRENVERVSIPFCSWHIYIRVIIIFCNS